MRKTRNVTTRRLFKTDWSHHYTTSGASRWQASAPVWVVAKGHLQKKTKNCPFLLRGHWLVIRYSCWGEKNNNSRLYLFFRSGLETFWPGIICWAQLACKVKLLIHDSFFWYSIMFHVLLCCLLQLPSCVSLDQRTFMRHYLHNIIPSVCTHVQKGVKVLLKTVWFNHENEDLVETFFGTQENCPLTSDTRWRAAPGPGCSWRWRWARAPSGWRCRAVGDTGGCWGWT